MRPRRIARRILARWRHWNVPHVHCPGCGADSSVPQDEDERPCFTCQTPWFRLLPSGDEERDRLRIRERARGREHVVVWSPLVVDVEKGDRRGSQLLAGALVYFPDLR
jgi:hypothetical protein